MAEKIVWINGREQNQLSVFDRGLAYGHGVFETILFRSRKLQLLDLHLQRLEQGLQCLGIEYSLELIQEELERLILNHPALPNGIVKIIITAGDSERGYAWPQPMQSTRILIWSQYDDAQAAQLKQQGAHLLLSSVRLAHQPLLAGIKHLNRLEQILIRREVEQHQCDEALVLDSNEHVIEANSANIFMVHQGQISTPQLHLCGVAGVMRRYLLETFLPFLDFYAEEKIISLSELYQADEVFLTNSIWGVVAAVRLKRANNEAISWSSGSITQKIQQALLRQEV